MGPFECACAHRRREHLPHGKRAGYRGGQRNWNMTKADLIEELSKVCNLTKKEGETIVTTVFDSIADALAKGDKVELRGFGSFRIRRRRARRGRNPKTGIIVSVPAKRVPFFKVGKRLRELVNA